MTLTYSIMLDKGDNWRDHPGVGFQSLPIRAGAGKHKQTPVPPADSFDTGLWPIVPLKTRVS